MPRRPAPSYWPSAAELEAAFVWTANNAPSPLARAIAGVAIRNGDISIGGLRNGTIDKARCSAGVTQGEIDRAFLVDRALMVDASFDFEDQVLQAIIYLQMNPFEQDPDRAAASNLRASFSRQYNESITLGAVIVAALILGYVLDPTFAEQDRDLDGDAFFDIPDARYPAIEIFARGRAS